MASYHLTAKIGAKGRAASHAAYISREGKYSGSERYEDLEATGHGNMPKWAERNTAYFWNAADEYERANGSVYREIEVALPRELTPEQRRELVEDFVRRELGDQHVYQWAIHTPNAALEKGEQPHAHIMYSERRLDGIERDPAQFFKRYNAKNPERGGAQKASGGKARGQMKDELLATRERWAEVQNTHLERHGHAGRVDHRSLKDQGIERAPEKHLGGPGVRALAPQDIGALLAHRAAEGERDRAQYQVASLIDLSGDLRSAMADRDRRQAAAQEQQRQEQQERERAAQAEAQKHQAMQAQLATGRADFRTKFEAHKAEKERQRLAELGRAELERQKAAEQERQRQQVERERAAKAEPERGRSPKGPSISR